MPRRIWRARLNASQIKNGDGSELFSAKTTEIRSRPHLSRGGGVRTHDLLVPNQARYQLRYAPMAGPRSVILGPAENSLPHRRLKSLRQMFEKPLEFVEIGKRDHDSACPLAVGVDHHFHAQCPP